MIWQLLKTFAGELRTVMHVPGIGVRGPSSTLVRQMERGHWTHSAHALLLPRRHNQVISHKYKARVRKLE
jgi:hypothetical protein